MAITPQPSNGRVDAASFWTNCGGAAPALQKKQPNSQSQSTVAVPVLCGTRPQRPRLQGCQEEIREARRAVCQILDTPREGAMSSWETLGSPGSKAPFSRNRGPACVLGNSPVFYEQCDGFADQRCELGRVQDVGQHLSRRHRQL